MLKQSAEKHRIEYIDLIKGITIVLVMYYHCPIPEDNAVMHMLSYARMPIYIFLSGLFFPTYDSFKEFAVKKTNRYIIPFCFFISISLILLPLQYSDISYERVKGIIYTALFYLDISKLNVPLWFLSLLVWLSILSYCLDTTLNGKSTFTKIFVCIVLSIISFTFHLIHNKYRINCHALNLAYSVHLILAFIVLPLFYIPHLHRHYILSRHRPLYIWIGLPMAFIILYLSGKDTSIDLNHYILSDNYIQFMCNTIAGIYLIYIIGYLLQRMPYFSYVGRYSIISLGTHYIILNCMLTHLGIKNCCVLFVILLITAPIIIWAFKRYFPYFTAQKDLLKIDENGKIKISFKD